MSLSVSDLNSLKAFVRLLAAESGAIIRSRFRTPIAIDLKSDSTPVTEADRFAEERIRELITREFPDHGILGEEMGGVNEDARYKWVLDPIDGTKSFINGSFDFGTLIALLDGGQPILGAIHQPVLNELIIGDNTLAELNGAPVKVRDCPGLEHAVLLTTDFVDVGRFQDGPAFQALAAQVKLCRTWGNCFGYSLVAAGFADIMIDPIMSIWDSMALIPVIRGAGGMITDYQGNDPVTGSSIVACHPRLHSELIAALNPERARPEI